MPTARRGAQESALGASLTEPMREQRKHLLAELSERAGLPQDYDTLALLVRPMAILKGGHYEESVAMIDRLMATRRLNKDQRVYLETLVQLVEAYEAKHHPIDITGLHGADVLRHLLDENGMSASELARLLGVHPSMGSKILKGERALTLKHIRKLANRFKVSPDLFID